MLRQRYRNRIETLLAAGDTRIEGDRPWDVHVLNNRVYERIVADGMLPSPTQIATAAEGVLNIEDWHNFPDDYARTLMCWYQNFEQAWDSLSDRYDEQFFRMWRYYLLACAGGFRAGGNQLWQIVFSKDGVTGGYSADHIR